MHHGFVKIQRYPNLYIKKDKQQNIALISLHVDDLILIASVRGLVEEVKLHLSQEFDMRYLGQMDCCLGIKIERENGNTVITQRKYA